jgi:hypothetical protein
MRPAWQSKVCEWPPTMTSMSGFRFARAMSRRTHMGDHDDLIDALNLELRNLVAKLSSRSLSTVRPGDEMLARSG